MLQNCEVTNKDNRLFLAFNVFISPLNFDYHTLKDKTFYKAKGLLFLTKSVSYIFMSLQVQTPTALWFLNWLHEASISLWPMQFSALHIRVYQELSISNGLASLKAIIRPHLVYNNLTMDRINLLPYTCPTWTTFCVSGNRVGK